MSFSSSVKDEVAKIGISDNCDVVAELAGLLSMCATLKFRDFEISVDFNTENAATARRIFTFLKKYYSDNVDVLVSKSRQLKKNKLYTLALRDSGATKVLLYDTSFLRSENMFMVNYNHHAILKNSYSKRAYIRGAFLGAGSVSNPERQYHFELVSNKEVHAKFLSDLINSFGLSSKVLSRKDSYIVYLKSADQICDLLTIMGANKATLFFENVRAFKEVNNNVNRLINLDAANLNKLVNSSMAQLNDINYIDSLKGLESLPENLYEVARLRLNDNGMSLKEIGESLNPPISKSGVNHRFKKIKEIANKLRGEGNGDKNI